ncbi:glycoside hydrolase family 105 protein [Synechocystis sp. PCC 6714]|uniref:glycoside hydrolase family 88/105 protein n=2 Tax=unclassified Synechocystis TaxID=2640012 RepID=UPI00068ED022|nr:glycoside hydrolase family 88 protein [Synechocystis sp. PCC 6714]
MHRVADWQLKHPSKHPPTHWTQATYYTGMMALASVSDDQRYLKAMRKMASKNAYQPGSNRLFADDQAVIQTYAQLYSIDRKPEILDPSIELFDWMLTLPFDESLTWNNNIHNREWAWCDALFMAPPALALVSQATANENYLRLMDRLWWKTTDYLYDPQENLYSRDSRFFEQREPNGKKVFWSRGNGWVLAGLVRVLQAMPPDFPSRPRYENLYKEMAKKIATLQSEDGYWRSSLLDPKHLPNPETSGTAFFVYALTWGINHDYLPKEQYQDSVELGWNALIQAIHPNGKLGYVQTMSVKPGATSYETTEVYGVGGFLLAGSQLLQMIR